MRIRCTHKPFIAAKMVPLLLMLVLIFCAGLVTAHGQGWIYPPVYIYGYLDGTFETPPNGSTYTGTAVMSYNLYGAPSPVTETAVACSVTLPMGFPAVDVGIYGPATPFQTAPLLFDLGQPGLITNVVEVVISQYSTNVIFGCATNLSLTPQQINDLDAGLWYVNVSSAAYEGGEIRGQLSNQPMLSLPVFQNSNAVAFNVAYAPAMNIPQQDPLMIYVNYEVQTSTDLLNWTTFTNFSSTDPFFQVVDTEATNTNGSQRFYRATAEESF